MRVSIIIPVYNTEAFLRECLDSVLAQTHHNIEVIAVDDGSTDSSGSILDEYAAADSRIKVIHQANAGVSQARNVGMDAATGEWIMFVDSDDFISPTLTEALLDTSTAFPQAQIVSSAIGFNKLSPHHRPTTQAYQLTSHRALELMLRQRGRHLINNSSPCAKLLRRTVIDGCLFMPDTKYEDLEWLSRVYMLSDVKHVAFLPERLYYYRQHAGAFSGHFSASRLDALRITQIIEERCNTLARPLKLAARDRRFSAAYNVFNLLTKNNNENRKTILDHCLHLIRERRYEVLFSNKARLKNRIGAAASYFGLKAMNILSIFQDMI